MLLKTDVYVLNILEIVKHSYNTEVNGNFKNLYFKMHLMDLLRVHVVFADYFYIDFLFGLPMDSFNEIVAHIIAFLANVSLFSLFFNPHIIERGPEL